MWRKATGLALGFATLLLGFPAEAQDAKPAKIGWLGARSASAPARDVFTRELRALGYAERKNVAIEYRYAEGRLERLPALANELVRLGVHVLVTPSTSAALAAKNATRMTPIIFYTGYDPVAAGLVESLARPGGNLTGFTTVAAILVGKQIELLKETIPKLSRVAALWNPKEAPSAQTWKEGQFPARELGVELHSAPVSSADQFEDAFRNAIKAKSDALILMPGAFFFSHQKRIVELAAKNRLPAIYPERELTASGGLMSYGADPVEPYRRLAAMVDKILKGSRPADLPVEQPTKFELIINLKTAHEIGVAIPAHVLARADRVIK